MADVLVKAIYNSAPKTLVRRTIYTAGGPYNLFQIAGGCIHVKALFGICITASTGNVLQLLGFTPTLGAAGLQALGVQAAAAVTAIGSLVAWAGTLITTWTRTAAGWGDPTTANMSFLGNNINFSPGIIQESAALADVSLVMDWYIVYMPGDPGVTVTIL